MTRDTLIFCCFELDPDTLQVRRLVERLSCMLRLLTVTIPLFRQGEKPLLERICEPTTALVEVLRVLVEVKVVV